MLTLERTDGQAILIKHNNETIEIRLDIKNNRAKVSIDAPDDYFIIREKLDENV